MNSISFTEALVKGKIAELIFAQMLRGAKFKKGFQKGQNVFTVLHFGYEHILPALVVNRKIKEEKNTTLDAIRTAPDFAIINNKTHEVSLIEVKYRSNPNKSNILKTAKKMDKSWKTAKLFLATPGGFYFDDIKKIIENEGIMEDLNHSEISEEDKKKYLDLLIKYEIN